MRSEWLIVTAAVAAGGCDLVFGLGDPQPCEAHSFDGATPHAITQAETFTMSRDQSVVVLKRIGLLYQASPIDAEPVPIDLGVYDDSALAMAPEGTSMFYTANVEPLKLLGALRGDTTWKLDATVPAGTYAGTPSADEYGPRRVLVRMHPTVDALIEYEDDNGVWTPLGDPHPFASGAFAPNLTPNGLTLVYSVHRTQADLTPDVGVYIATRPSRDVWFSGPVMVLAGDHHTPQLLDTCRALYTIDPDAAGPGPIAGELERYDLP